MGGCACIIRLGGARCYSQPPVNPARRRPVRTKGLPSAQLPEQPGTVIFDHQHDHPLVEAESALRNPAIRPDFASRSG